MKVRQSEKFKLIPSQDLAEYARAKFVKPNKALVRFYESKYPQLKED
jgi:hypothetical protein